ncbi:reverse transcriptase domain-containing protein [Tanacetum coccineum]
MHTCASNSELVEPLPEPECTLNRRLRLRNKRVPFKRRDERPTQPRIVYLPILDINYFRNFFDILENYNPMDDEPMWAADHVVAPTPGSAITIPETANEFAIKSNYLPLVKGNQFDDKVLLKLDWAKNQKPKYSFKKTVAFADEGNSNSDTDKIMARMDAMTMKMDAQYKDMQSRLNHSIPEYDEEDKPMSPEAEAKFMQTFRRTCFYNDYRDQAKFGRFADKQSGRPSGSFLSSTQPNPKEAQYGKFLDTIRVVQINVPLVDVLARMPNYGKFLKELVSNKHKLEQISSAFLSDESSAMIQNKVPPKLGDPGSFLIPCIFSKAFSCNALADLGASINRMPYSLYAKLSLETLKPTKMRVRLADWSFQHPIGIAENMLVEVGEFTFLVDFVILEMKEDSKVHLILGRAFLHTSDAVI